MSSAKKDRLYSSCLLKWEGCAVHSQNRTVHLKVKITLFVCSQGTEITLNCILFSGCQERTSSPTCHLIFPIALATVFLTFRLPHASKLFFTPSVSLDFPTTPLSFFIYFPPPLAACFPNSSRKSFTKFTRLFTFTMSSLVFSDMSVWKPAGGGK